MLRHLAAQPRRFLARRAMSAATLEVRDGGVAVLKLDAAGERVNLLGRAMMADLEPILARVETEEAIRGVVIISGKADDFIAGADISMLDAAGTAPALAALATTGQAMMDRLAAVAKRKPVVAAINGSCLGGGLELALACSYRVATRSAKTKLGLPEVKLGLLPGAGGTQRLPKLVGLQEAIALITAGSTVKPERALKLGLVNAIVEPAALEATALHAVRELVAGRLKPAAPKARGVFAWLLEGNALGRSVLWSQARKAIDKATAGKYPAPFAILDVIRAGVDGGLAAGLKAEAEAFGRLGSTRESRALRGIFFSDTATKRAAAAFGKPPFPVQTVGIVGAGLMGAGIAQVSSVAGLRVVLKDKEAAAVARGEKQIAASLAALVKRRRLTPFEQSVAESGIYGVSDTDSAWPAHMARCDAVIEAVFENLAVKHAVIAQLESIVRADALLATNTSAIPIAKVAAAAKHPERIVGIHYFSPVDKMPLAEVIPHAGSSPAAVATAVALAQKQGKTVIIVKDVPGFYVNRCLGPYMAEGMALVLNGVDPVALDAALKSFGFPVGPVSLMDEVRAQGGGAMRRRAWPRQTSSPPSPPIRTPPPHPRLASTSPSTRSKRCATRWASAWRAATPRRSRRWSRASCSGARRARASTRTPRRTPRARRRRRRRTRRAS
jgi:enoyl-CoA hydratase/long-chain 3-hydroxyacyl-CoA dehydrogenase